ASEGLDRVTYSNQGGKANEIPQAKIIELLSQLLSGGKVDLKGTNLPSPSSGSALAKLNKEKV
ncbi:MAG: hypothetical protein DRP42_06475, partial [Tenericutes bacterium]